MKVRTPLILSTKTLKKLLKDNCMIQNKIQTFQKSYATAETQAVSSSRDLCNNVL